MADVPTLSSTRVLVVGAGSPSPPAGGVADDGRRLAAMLTVALARPSIDEPDLCLDPRGGARPQGGTP